MNTAELTDALDGLHAYDTGSTDSGIHDEALRAKCIAELRRHLDSADEGRLFISRLLRNMWLSDHALAQGYGYEDLLGFVEWLSDYMELDLR